MPPKTTATPAKARKLAEKARELFTERTGIKLHEGGHVKRQNHRMTRTFSTGKNRSLMRRAKESK